MEVTPFFASILVGLIATALTFFVILVLPSPISTFVVLLALVSMFYDMVLWAARRLFSPATKKETT